MREQAQIIRWEQPPPHRAGGRPRGVASSRFGAVAEQLRDQRRRWAVVAEFTGRVDNSLALKINRGSLLCFTPAGAFEAVTRRFEGTTTVYARYLGDGGGDSA